MTDVPTTVPTGNLLVRVHAIGLGREDVEDVYHISSYFWLRSKGRRLGSSFSGIVELVGGNCGKFQAGDEVIGMVLNPSMEGSGADFLVIAEGLCTSKPSSVTHNEAVTIISDAMLAERTLRVVKAKDTDAILITGGSCNLARMLIELAKSAMFGVEWVASSVDRTEDKEYAESVGADETFVTSCHGGNWSEPFESGINRKEYEVVIDLVGDSKHAKRLLAEGGRFVSLFNKPTPSELLDFDARVGSRWLSSRARFFLSRNAKLANMVAGCSGRMTSCEGKYFSVIASGDGEILERIVVLIDTGTLTGFVEKVFGISEISNAVSQVKKRPFSRGRVVVSFVS